MKRKIDYELKKKALDSGYCELANKISSYIYHYHQAGLTLTLEELNNLYEFLETKEDYILYSEAKKINYAFYKRKSRLNDKISDMLSNSTCLFLTLTFTDDVLEKTNELTRRRYVSRFLKNVSDNYVANIDYGARKEREHYHAVIVSDHIDYKDWFYGNIDFQRIRSNSDSVKLSKYIAKLTNHAIKETTKRNSIIYSKKKKVE